MSALTAFSAAVSIRPAAPRRTAQVVRAGDGMASKGGEEGVKKFDKSGFGVLSGNMNYAIMGAAMAKAGLESTLSLPNGPFTIFAVQDDSWSDAAKKLGTTKMELMNLPNFNDIVKGHIVEGEFDWASLPDSIPTMAGTNIDKASLKTKKQDFKVENGYVHVITDVLC